MVLAIAIVGCADDDPAALGPGSGGTGGELAGAGGNAGTSGAAGDGAGGGTTGTAGTSGAGTAGASGSSAAAGRGGTGGGPAVLRSCGALGWEPGAASTCNGTRDGKVCALCSLPRAFDTGMSGLEPCVSTTAFASAPVVCVVSCGDCQ